MSKDYYKILGVDKDASHDDIKKAFLKLAHQHHPDKKGGDEAKFKEASEAYAVLSDKKKRNEYDTYGKSFAGGQGGGPQGGQGGFNGFGGFDFSNISTQGGQAFEFDLGDIFGEFFGGGRRRVRKGRNITVDLQISFKESVFGAEKEIGVGGRKEKLIIKIPPGIDEALLVEIAPSDEHVGAYDEFAGCRHHGLQRRGQATDECARRPVSLKLVRDGEDGNRALRLIDVHVLHGNRQDLP